VVESDFSTKGSETVKVGTDEQKVHKRLYKVGEQTHRCDAQRRQEIYTVDVSGIDGRKTLLPGEVFTTTSWLGEEVSRGHSTLWIRVDELI